MRFSEDAFLYRDGSGGDIVKYNAKNHTVELFFEATILVGTIS